MESKYGIIKITDDDKGKIKNTGVLALPDSPAAYGMKAGAVKPKFWKPLVEGDDSIVGHINRLIDELCSALDGFVQDISFDEATHSLKVSFGEEEKTLCVNSVRIAGIEQTKTSEESDGINVLTVKLSDGSSFDFTVRNGSQGARGDNLVTFYKSYDSVEQMNAAADQDGVPVYGLVIISGNTENKDAGKVFRKNSSGKYECMADLSGLQGPSGYTPVRGKDYWTDADKDEIKQYVEDAILGGAW